MKNIKADYFIYAFFVIAGACVVFLCIQNVKQRDTIQSMVKVNQVKEQSLIIENERKYNYFSLKENGIEINKSILLEDSAKILFSNYIKSIKRPRLILRFSYLGCNACIDSALSKLKKYDDLQENAAIFATYRNKIDLFKFNTVNRITLPSYNIKEGEKVLRADELLLPYMFILKPNNNQIYDLFFPIKEEPKRTEEYLETIAEKYFIKS